MSNWIIYKENVKEAEIKTTIEVSSFTSIVMLSVGPEDLESACSPCDLPQVISIGK